MANTKPTSDGIQFDSKEEVAFFRWLKDAKEFGLVESFETSCHRWQLTDEVKVSGKTILRASYYTPDFYITYTPTGEEVFGDLYVAKLPFFFGLGREVIVDVKASFNRFGGSRIFAMHQKMLYESHQRLVQEVVTDMLFQATWIPEDERYSPKKRIPRDKYKAFKTVRQFLGLEEQANGSAKSLFG